MESRESTPSSSKVLIGIGILAVGVAAGTYAMMGSEDIAEAGRAEAEAEAEADRGAAARTGKGDADKVDSGVSGISKREADSAERPEMLAGPAAASVDPAAGDVQAGYTGARAGAEAGATASGQAGRAGGIGGSATPLPSSKRCMEVLSAGLLEEACGRPVELKDVGARKRGELTCALEADLDAQMGHKLSISILPGGPGLEPSPIAFNRVEGGDYGKYSTLSFRTDGVVVSLRESAGTSDLVCSEVGLVAFAEDARAKI